MPPAPGGFHQCIWWTASPRLPTPLAPLWFISADQAIIVQLIEEADETLFNNIRHNPLHILHLLLPKQIDCYSFRPRSHNFELTHNHDNKKFIDRMLFRNSCSLPNTYSNLHYGLHNFIVLSWHFLLHYIITCRFIAIIAL